MIGFRHGKLTSALPNALKQDIDRMIWPSVRPSLALPVDVAIAGEGDLRALRTMLPLGRAKAGPCAFAEKRQPVGRAR